MECTQHHRFPRNGALQRTTWMLQKSHMRTQWLFKLDVFVDLQPVLGLQALHLGTLIHHFFKKTKTLLRGMQTCLLYDDAERLFLESPKQAFPFLQWHVNSAHYML